MWLFLAYTYVHVGAFKCEKYSLNVKFWTKIQNLKISHIFHQITFICATFLWIPMDTYVDVAICRHISGAWGPDEM